MVYKIRDFKTSPLESAVSVGSRWHSRKPSKVEGIEVDQKLDALFFLHTMDISRRAERWLKDDRWRQREPGLALKYIVNYRGGRREEIPVYLSKGIHHWIREEPLSMEGASVAWAAPFDQEEKEGLATLYSMQWTNPHPELPVASVDIHAGKGGGFWGTPVVPAITAAKGVRD